MEAKVTPTSKAAPVEAQPKGPAVKQTASGAPMPVKAPTTVDIKQTAPSGRSAPAGGKSLARMLDTFNLDQGTFAHYTDLSKTTVAKLLKGSELSTGTQKKVAAFTDLLQQLGRAMPKEQVKGWLESPNKSLQGKKPEDLIRQGNYDMVWKAAGKA